MGSRAFGLAIISGGSSGIGKACAAELIARGHPVALLARDADRLAAARQELLARCAGGTVLTASVDMRDQAASERTVAALIAAHGAPEWVIASAGMARPGLFLEQPAEDHAEHMQTNFLGTVHLIRAAAPSMARARRGRIVLVASGASFLGIYGYSAYAPSKFAIRGLAEILRLELAGHGISVTVACPPDTDTPQLDAEERSKPALTRKITAGGGLWPPEKVASAIVAAAGKGRFMVGPGLAIGALSRFHSLAEPIFRLHQARLLRQETRRAARAGKSKRRSITE